MFEYRNYDHHSADYTLYSSHACIVKGWCGTTNNFMVVLNISFYFVINKVLIRFNPNTVVLFLLYFYHDSSIDSIISCVFARNISYNVLQYTSEYMLLHRNISQCENSLQYLPLQAIQ